MAAHIFPKSTSPAVGSAGGVRAHPAKLPPSARAALVNMSSWETRASRERRRCGVSFSRTCRKSWLMFTPLDHLPKKSASGAKIVSRAILVEFCPQRGGCPVRQGEASAEPDFDL